MRGVRDEAIRDAHRRVGCFWTSALLVLSLMVFLVAILSRNLFDVPLPPDDTHLRVNAPLPVPREIDASPPGDSDRHPSPAGIEREENAWESFLEANKALVLTDDQVSRLEELEESGYDDDGWVAELLAANEEYFRLCRRAQEAPFAQASFGPCMKLRDWRLCKGVQLLRLRHEFARGSEDDALREAIWACEFAHKLANGLGPPIYYHFAKGFKDACLEVLISMLCETVVGKETLLPYAARLEALHEDGTALARVIAMEYAECMQYMEETLAPETEGEALGEARELDGRLPWYLYHPNRTKEILYEYVTAYIEDSGEVYSDMRLPNLEDSVSLENTWLFALLPNVLGKMMLMLVPSNEQLARGKCKTNTRIAAAQAILALKCYYRDHHRLPASLEELVPAYLPEAPLDDFDGEALRYSAERRLVYSVGQDLVDAGGSEPEGPPFRLPDPSWRVAFSQ